METKTKTPNKQDVSILNDLVQINNDRITGYEKAIKGLDGKDQQLSQTFSKMISQSQQIKNDLQKFISKSGGEISESRTAGGAIYQAWMDIRNKFSNRKDLSNIELSEYGEDAAQATYKKALESKDLSPELRELITNQMSELRKSHDEIRTLRDEYQPH